MGLGGLAHSGVGGVRLARTVGSVVFVSSGLGSPPGDVLLVLAAGSRLSAYISAAVGENRIPAWFLDGWFKATGLARRLRGVDERVR